jgi:protein SEY1
MNVEPSHLFEISVEYLEHLKFAKAKFEQGIQDMRTSLVDPTHPKYYFKNFEYSKNLPAEALCMFIDNLWATIKNNKDINLPAQKVIIANIRCDEIKKEIEKQFKEGLSSRQRSLNFDHFGLVGKELLNAALVQYDTEASSYFKDVYLAVRTQLENAILDDLYKIFENLRQKP